MVSPSDISNESQSCGQIGWAVEFWKQSVVAKQGSEGGEMRLAGNWQL